MIETMDMSSEIKKRRKKLQELRKLLKWIKEKGTTNLWSEPHLVHKKKRVLYGKITLIER
jgi:hypothetical protein